MSVSQTHLDLIQPREGLFLGKSLAKNHVDFQTLVLELDRLIIFHDGFGFVGNKIYQIAWHKDGSINGQKSYFRQIFAPRPKLLELLKSQNDGWEAYLVDTKGERKGTMSNIQWDWCENINLVWKGTAMFQFTKL